MNALLKHTLQALDRITDYDNPARVAPPVLQEECTDRQFIERSDKAQRRLIDHWLSCKRNSDDILGDLFSDMDWQRLMPHVVAGDDCEIGRQVVLKLKELGKAIDEDDAYWERECER